MRVVPKVFLTSVFFIKKLEIEIFHLAKNISAFCLEDKTHLKISARYCYELSKKDWTISVSTSVFSVRRYIL